MTDFEHEVRAMLKDKAAGMPNEYNASTEYAGRVSRRRTAKLYAVGGSITAIALIAVGSVAFAGRDGGNDKSPIDVSNSTVATSPETTVSPATVAPETPVVTAPPTTASSIETDVMPTGCTGPTTLNAEQPAPKRGPLPFGLWYFTVDNTPAGTVLAPEDWTCTSSDGFGMEIRDPEYGDELDAPVEVYHYPLGSESPIQLQACVWDDPAIDAWAMETAGYGECDPDPVPSRPAPNVSTWVDPTMTSRLAIAHRTSADDAAEPEGTFTAVNCMLDQPVCDAIFADYIERNA